ncbi:MAG: lysozyme inhibitor LprI family protein [Acidobacteriota bacterium]|nr:lysozyme inhibitor LprI family protein [Acidobacteriota bacterium]
MRALLLVALTPAWTLAQTVPRETKIVPSEQAAYQQALTLYNTQLDTLRAAATKAVRAEALREGSEACPKASTTYAYNLCLAHEVTLTEANYKAFTAALRAMLALPEPERPGAAYPLSGPSGPEATPATSTAAFDKSEVAWRAYATAQCDAVDVQWRGGTIVNSMVHQCSIRQTRSRLHELDTAYSEILHQH